MSSTHRHRLTVAAASLLVAVAACQAPGVGVGGATLKIGAVYPLSGPQAEGSEELAGVRAAAEVINHSGGVGGRQVEIVSADAPSATDGARAVDRLLDQGIHVIIGTYGSTQALTASARASERGATYLETGAVADSITGRGLQGILRTVATGSTLGRNGARWTQSFLLPGFGLTPASARIVILFEGDTYGSAVGYGAIDEADALGLNVVDTVKYDAATADYDQLADRILQDRPDIILTASYLEDGVAFRRAAVAHHIPVKTIVGTSSAYCHPQFGDLLGQDAVGLFASDKPDEDFREEALSGDARTVLKQAKAAFRARTGGSMTAAGIAGFVGGWVMFHDILPHARSTSRDDVVSAALALDLPVGSEINGAGVKFAGPGEPDAGQNRRAVSVIWEWVGVRQRAVVYPPTYASAAPQILAVAT